MQFYKTRDDDLPKIKSPVKYNFKTKQKTFCTLSISRPLPNHTSAGKEESQLPNSYMLESLSARPTNLDCMEIYFRKQNVSIMRIKTIIIAFASGPIAHNWRPAYHPSNQCRG